MQRFMDRSNDGFLASEAAGAGHSTGEVALIGIDNFYATNAKHLDIFLSGSMIPHVDVHCGCDNNGRRAGEIQRGEKIVSDAARELGENVRSGWRNEKEIGALRDGDML